MAVNEALIKRLEELSMLSLTNDERQTIKAELEKMIKMIDKMSELETENIKPLVHIGDHVQDLDTDKVKNMINSDSALMNAKKITAPFFTVPKVINRKQ